MRGGSDLVGLIPSEGVRNFALREVGYQGHSRKLYECQALLDAYLIMADVVHRQSPAALNQHKDSLAVQLPHSVHPHVRAELVLTARDIAGLSYGQSIPGRPGTCICTWAGQKRLAALSTHLHHRRHLSLISLQKLTVARTRPRHKEFERESISA